MAIYNKFYSGTVSDWASLAVSIWFIGGIQLVSLGLGLIGEYIGKIYLEVKQRPKYIVALVLAPKNNDHHIRLYRKGKRVSYLNNIDLLLKVFRIWSHCN